MADLDLSMSLFDFLEVVDLPRVHPQEVLQEVQMPVRSAALNSWLPDISCTDLAEFT